MNATLWLPAAVAVTLAVVPWNGHAPMDLGPVDVAQSTAEPRLVNGRLDPHAAAAGLAGEFDAAVRRVAEPGWIGYAVPMTPGDRTMCDWGDSMRGIPTAPVHLEPADAFFVFYRVEQGQVVRIRAYSEDCPLDAGGKAVQWLTEVRPAESVALLRRFVTPAAASRVSDGAMSAIAMHDGADALDALIGFARDGQAAKVRGSALFWLSQRAGQKAVGAIADAIERDPDTEVKKRAVFALSQLPHDEGVPRLIDVARTNKNPAVRKQAMFWLGQSKDPRALQFFQEILK